MAVRHRLPGILRSTSAVRRASSAVAEAWDAEVEDFAGGASAAAAAAGAETSKSAKQIGLDLVRAHSRSQLGSYRGLVTPDAVAFALQKTRRPADAMALFDWASRRPGFRHDEETASALLGVYVKARLFREACRLLSQDLRHICACSRLAFSTLASGYCYVGNMEAAILLLREMERLGLNIDVPLHNSVLKGLCKANRVEEAVAHYEKMVANRDADFSSHKIMIIELCKVGKVDRAVNIMYAMGDGVVDLSIFNAIIAELCKLKVDVAYMLVEQMIDGGCLPDVSTYRSLVLGCFNSGQLVEASKIMRQMVEMGCVPDLETYTAFIRALCKLRRVEDARQLLDDMTYRGVVPDVCTHNAFLAGLCKDGDRLDEAQRHLQKMIARGISPNTETYGMLIRALCKEYKVVEAHRLFNEMLGRGCVPDVVTYNTLIAGHCDARKLSASYQLLKQMLEKGLVPDVDMSESVVHQLQRRGRNYEAKDIAKRLS